MSLKYPLLVLRWFWEQWIRPITKDVTVEKTGEMSESLFSYNKVRRFELTKNNQTIFTIHYLCVCNYTFLGSFDISGLPDSKGHPTKAGEMPTYVNTEQIDAQVLAALQAEAENVPKGSFASGAKDSPPKDLFDMSKLAQVL